MYDLDRLSRYALRVSPRYGADALQDVLLARLGTETDAALLAYCTARRIRRLAYSDARRARREQIAGLRRGVATVDADPIGYTLDDLLTPLPRRVRAVVRRVALGETQASIAKRLGVSQVTVSNLYRLGIRLLRVHLQPR